MLAEKNMEVLQDETIDPNIQAFSLNVFNSIASINQEIVAQFIEPLSLATLRMLSNSGMFDDLLYVYEIIPVISHFIEAGSEGDALLLKMLSKAIKSIGMLSVIPDNVCDVSIDLLYLASTRFQEFWETARPSKAARNIIKAAEVCTDPTTVQRKTALKPQIPE